MRCHAARALWFLGQPDQALARMQDALALARELSEPNSLAHVFYYAATAYQLRREARLAQEHAEAALAVASEHGLVLYQAMAAIIRGWALLEQGREAEAIEQMRQGLAAYQATGAEVSLPHFLALLAEAMGNARQPEEGLRVLEEAFEVARRNREGWYLAELYRIKGELLLMQSTGRNISLASPGRKDVEIGSAECGVRSLTVNRAAESCFLQAVEIAQRQQAKSLELRAVMSLARLYRNQGKPEEARSLLAPIYRNFSEGFATADLRETKVLLDALS